jgi:excisionase family DNA binding protein
MSLTAHRQLPPTSSDAALARTSGRVLARYAEADRPLRLRITDAGQEKLIELPAGAVTLLMNILDAMATGRGVTLVPEDVELTTVQAAEILAVSRPFLIKLLDEGAIPHRKVGKHRRVRLEDVIAYKEKIDRDREAVLDELAAQAQQLEMGYEPPHRSA